MIRSQKSYFIETAIRKRCDREIRSRRANFIQTAVRKSYVRQYDDILGRIASMQVNDCRNSRSVRPNQPYEGRNVMNESDLNTPSYDLWSHRVVKCRRGSNDIADPLSTMSDRTDIWAFTRIMNWILAIFRIGTNECVRSWEAINRELLISQEWDHADGTVYHGRIWAGAVWNIVNEKAVGNYRYHRGLVSLFWDLFPQMNALTRFFFNWYVFELGH